MYQLKNVKKTYKLGEVTVEALNGIDLNIQKKDFIAIAGSSGSGKTTLLNLLGFIDVPTSGVITYKNRVVSALGESKLNLIRRNEVGYIFQNFNLIPVLNAFENIEYALVIHGKSKKSDRIEKVNYYLDKVGLFEHRFKRPNQLSGGQCQRVAIARALVKKPEIILADEPTANLDSKTGSAIIELLKGLNQEETTTFIFSSHDSRIIGYASKVINISDGKII